MRPQLAEPATSTRQPLPRSCPLPASPRASVSGVATEPRDSTTRIGSRAASLTRALAGALAALVLLDPTGCGRTRASTRSASSSTYCSETAPYKDNFDLERASFSYSTERGTYDKGLGCWYSGLRVTIEVPGCDAGEYALPRSEIPDPPTEYDDYKVLTITCHPL